MAQPDAARVQRNLETIVPVLANDRDPDGDPLTVTVVEPLPPALDVQVEGEHTPVTARGGSAHLLPFSYEIDDGRGGTARGSVLVHVDDDVPNRPPLANPDTASVVTGASATIDVVANDIDPDGDPLVVVATGTPDLGGRAVVAGNQVRYEPPAGFGVPTGPCGSRTPSRDGAGHEVRGDVAVRVLAERRQLPPWARDDSATTYVDEARGPSTSCATTGTRRGRHRRWPASHRARLAHAPPSHPVAGSASRRRPG